MMIRAGFRPRIMYVTNNYPTIEAPYRGVFLHRSINELGADIVPLVVHIQSWRPSREIVNWRLWESVPVLTLSLPQIHGGNHRHINAQLQALIGWHFVRDSIKQVELIHSLNLYSSGYVAGKWANRLNKPHVSHGIGSDINVYLHHYSSPRRFSWLDNVEFVVCNSNALVRNLLQYSGKQLKVKSVYRGVDIKEFTPNGPLMGPQSGKPQLRFLFLGGIASSLAHKGCYVLMHAWRKIEAEVGGSTLAMGGPYVDKPTIDEWRRTLLKPEQVFSVNTLAPDDVPAYIRACDVVIIPSLAEGLPNLANEAQACGCPVLASNVGGLPESVIDNQTGKLVKSGDPDALAEGILWFVSNKDGLSAMSQQARQNVAERFTWQRFTEEILQIYRNILA